MIPVPFSVRSAGLVLLGALLCTASGYAPGSALEFLATAAARPPEVLSVGYRGESEAVRQTGSSIWIVFGFTLATIFLVPLLCDRLARRTSSPQTVARQLAAELDGPVPEPA